MSRVACLRKWMKEDKFSYPNRRSGDEVLVHLPFPKIKVVFAGIPSHELMIILSDKQQHQLRDITTVDLDRKFAQAGDLQHGGYEYVESEHFPGGQHCVCV